MPGGLQLLPSERYPSGWQKVQQDHKEILSLPKVDPYEEIYTLKDNKWYKLINEEWLNPVKNPEAKLTRTFQYFYDTKDFHQNIGATYHDTTYLSYGADLKQKAWNTVVWEAGNAPLSGTNDNDYPAVNAARPVMVDAGVFNWQTQQDSGKGKIEVAAESGQLCVVIGPAQDAADGTVPTPSAEDPVQQGKPKITFKQQGYDHQDTYQHKAMINVTLYSLARIAHDAFDWWT